MKISDEVANERAKKDRGPHPALFYVMLALIVVALVVTVVMSPAHVGGANAGHGSPSQSASH